MAYIPDWESLADSLKRLRAAGLSKSEAQHDICGALADRKLLMRYRSDGAETTDGQTVPWPYSYPLVIPADLSPRDFDWRQSHPMRPWLDENYRSYYVHIALIELLSADVIRILCVPAKHRLSPQSRFESLTSRPATAATGRDGAAANEAAESKTRRRKSRPTFERAQNAISELYPKGVPEPAKLSNKHLCRRVGEKLEEDGLPALSDDSILRAAGRRK